MIKPKIPNNPYQAYLMGKRHGMQDNMDLVAVCLLDKCGFHAKSEDVTDRQSIEYLYGQLTEYAAEINSGRIKRRDIKEMLCDEAKISFSD